ncbi:MAG TPA: tetratricopeptide repeat protein [Gaiellaceae bacterium]|nr:tetratricopeptide repeat protein [Gaiellaceae bacterium]
MRILAATTVIVALALVALLGGVVRESSSAATATSAPIEARKLALAGLTYTQRARDTGDAAYVSRADRALRQALKLEPENLDALTGLGGVELTRHRFRNALGLARRALAVAPEAAAPHGVLGDSLLELGRYDAAFATFDRMAALKPNTSSYSRISYARELRGEIGPAIDAMTLALDTAVGRPEAYAWVAVELGKLHWSVGRSARAASFYRLALAARPGYAPALDALARFEVARGRLGRAVALQRRAVEAVPLPGYVAQFGDLLVATGRLPEARKQYGLVAAIAQLQAANGSKTDLESALYRTDHGIGGLETLELARQARAERPSITGDDVLAWALARNGRCREARHYSERALRLGTRDASFYFHRGMIERCLGRNADAGRWFRRALDTNPHFSLLWSSTARRYAS